MTNLALNASIANTAPKKKGVNSIEESLERIAIDSLLLRIPTSLVQSMDSRLTDIHGVINIDSGEIDEASFKLQAVDFWNEDETIKCKALVRNVTTSKYQSEECLLILLNSKILGSRYFEGLTVHNILDVYSIITQELRICEIGLKEFCKCKATDIDFRLDSRMKLGEWNQMLDSIALLTKPSTESGHGYRRFKPTKANPHNHGIQFSERATKSFKTPFLKFYHKQLELETKSADFYFNHLSNVNIEGIVRVETTVKNRDHAKSLGIKDTTLEALLTLNQTQLQSVFQRTLDKHLDRKSRVLTKPQKETNDMSPTDIAHYTCLCMLMESTNGNIKSVVEAIISTQKDSVSKSRMKSKLMDIYHSHIEGSNTDLNIKKIESYFSKIGWS